MGQDRWSEVRKLYHAARERGIAVLDGADPEIRREVESLLAQDSSPDALDRPPLVAIRAMSARSLAPGMKLGAYELVSRVGSGGMGEVWRARDSRLNRSVAIKISSARFSDRFEREARAIAALNHPHICQIYDVGPDYLVMEFIDGKPVKGPMALDAVLKRAIELAGAMEAAHRSEITHRDLKPDNILDTKSGIKVLDFGLAKVNDAKAASAGADATTLAQAITQEGTIIGTLQYMAPEQLQGQKIDSRADIFAFGCVLYEMLTGKRAFEGANSASVIAAILEREAPSVGSVAPASLDRVVKRCLAKDPGDRWQTARDLRAELEWIASGQGVAEPAKTGRGARWIAWAVGGVALLAITASIFIYFRSKEDTRRVVRLTIPGQTLALALSPNGQKIVISGDKGLAVRDLDGADFKALPDTAASWTPFWSPDSRSIGFFSENKLKVVSASGGPPRVLCEGAGNAFGGTWNNSGVILYGNRLDKRIWRVDSHGGPCTALQKPPPPGQGAAFPIFSGDGNHFFYFGRYSDSGAGIYLASLDEPHGHKILGDASSVVYAPPSRSSESANLLFIRDHTLMAQPFDDSRLQINGDPMPVSDQAAFSSAAPQIAADASTDGTLVYLTGRSRETQLTWFDRNGKELEKIGPMTAQGGMALSPDGSSVVSMHGGVLWLHDLTRNGSATRLTPQENSTGMPLWSGDSTRIWFFMGPNERGLYEKDIKADRLRLIAAGFAGAPAAFPVGLAFSDWSRDGRVLVFTKDDPATGADIWYVPVQQDKPGVPVKWLATKADEGQGQLSPDAKWMAYSAGDSGMEQIYVRSFPAGENVTQVSFGDAGREPRWRSDGKEIYFVSGGLKDGVISQIMAASVELDPKGGLRIGNAQKLFDVRYHHFVVSLSLWGYAPSLDGRRFLVNVPTEEQPTINVILNWQKALPQVSRR